MRIEFQKGAGMKAVVLDGPQQAELKCAAFRWMKGDASCADGGSALDCGNMELRAGTLWQDHGGGESEAVRLRAEENVGIGGSISIRKMLQMRLMEWYTLAAG